jgi:hypothetical protein
VVIICELIKSEREKTMTTITIDDEMISELVAVSHFKNAQEAVIKILTDYLLLHKKETAAVFNAKRFRLH